jgi:transposase
VLPCDWEVVELNPAHVAMQRKVNGQRGIKTDAVDATAMFDLIVAGRGSLVGTANDSVAQLIAWVGYRARRVAWKRAVGNHLNSQLDRAFPGVSGCLHQVLGTRVGRLVAAEFTDPQRLARMGMDRFRSFAARRGLRVSTPKATQLIDAARQALPAGDAQVAREAIAADLNLVEALETQIKLADQQLERLLRLTPFAVLTSTPGWAAIRAASYGAAIGDPGRWPSASKIYRASGLTPTIYESAGRRHDGGISREGSVALRHALLELGQGLRHHEPANRAYAAQLAARGKHSMIIWTALANRANRIAFAMVRDQTLYEPARWS